MHMGIFYYGVNLGLLLIFSFWYMKKNWTKEMFEGIQKDKEEEEK